MTRADTDEMTIQQKRNELKSNQLWRKCKQDSQSIKKCADGDKQKQIVRQKILETKANSRRRS